MNSCPINMKKTNQQMAHMWRIIFTKTGFNDDFLLGLRIDELKHANSKHFTHIQNLIAIVCVVLRKEAHTFDLPNRTLRGIG